MIAASRGSLLFRIAHYQPEWPVMLPLRVLSSAEAAHGGFFVVDERGERLRPSPTAMAEAEYSAISALQHWSYCPRQCALIHVDQAFADNLHTARGNAVHALVDQPGLPLRMERERIETCVPCAIRMPPSRSPAPHGAGTD